TYNNAKDVDYIPDNDNDDNSEEDQEVNTSVEVFKKQHRPQYIAPLSMNSIANLAKKNRMIAPKPTEKFPLNSNALEENQ
ncbi:hypothetical protein M8C21_015292, partial [Ambrosia artemisiifolia]